jgi:hypothetical protein
VQSARDKERNENFDQITFRDAWRFLRPPPGRGVGLGALDPRGRERAVIRSFIAAFVIVFGVLILLAAIIENEEREAERAHAEQMR